MEIAHVKIPTSNLLLHRVKFSCFAAGYEREMSHFTLALVFTDEEQVRREEERECSKEREQMH
jgi:hypothetical protein